MTAKGNAPVGVRLDDAQRATLEAAAEAAGAPLGAYVRDAALGLADGRLGRRETALDVAERAELEALRARDARAAEGRARGPETPAGTGPRDRGAEAAEQRLRGVRATGDPAPCGDPHRAHYAAAVARAQRHCGACKKWVGKGPRPARPAFHPTPRGG